MSNAKRPVQPHIPATVLDIQHYQQQFDEFLAAMVGTTAGEGTTFDSKTASVCLTEEAGEMIEAMYGLMSVIGRFARAVKKGSRAEANELMEEAAKWREKMLKEGVDIFIYLVKVFNAQKVDLETLYFEKMEENIAELENGGGKYLGKESING